MVSVTFCAFGSKATGVIWKFTAGVGPPAEKKACLIWFAASSFASTSGEMPRSVPLTGFHYQGLAEGSIMSIRLPVMNVSINPPVPKSLAKSAMPVSAAADFTKG